MSPTDVLYPNPPARADIEAWLGRIYPQAMAHARPADLLGEYCHRLAAHLGAVLVTVARAGEGGTLTLAAQSDEGPLWAELHRVPERWDECLAGNAAAGRALRAGQPVVVSSVDESLLPWRMALERERIASILAWPFDVAAQRHVLQVYGTRPLASEGLSGTVDALARLIADLRHLEHQHVLACALESAGNAAFITDLEGTIVWANESFARLSGYATGETVGRNPRFLSSGQQSVRYYRELWSTIRGGKVWSGETVDRDREGRSYAIHQTVSPVATGPRITHYLSIHDDVTQARRARQELERGQRSDPASGLLTPAAFEAAAEQVLRDAAPGQAWLLVLLAPPGWRTGGTASAGDIAGPARASEQLRAILPEAALACVPRAGELLILLPDDANDAGAHSPPEILRVLRAAGEGASELVAGSAAFPREASTYTELRLLAERRLAIHPIARADRRAPR